MSQGVSEIGELVDRVGRLTRGLQFVDGLSPAQWEALRFIARANRYSCNPSALADFLCATKGTVSQTVIALEGKGYLRRRPDGRDRRGVRLELTPAGRALLTNDPLLDVEAAAAGLTGRDRDVLIAGLRRLLDGLRRRDGGSAFGVCGACELFDGDGAAGDEGGPHRCGFTGEPLSAAEAGCLCVSFRGDA